MGRGYTTRPQGPLSQRGYCDALHSDSGPGDTMAANRCRRMFSDTRILADPRCPRAYCRRPADRAHRPAAAAPPRLPARHDALQRQRHLYRPLARALWRVCRGRGAAVQAPARAGRRGGRGRRQYRRLHPADRQTDRPRRPCPRLRAAAADPCPAAGQPGAQRARQRHRPSRRPRRRAGRAAAAAHRLYAAGEFRRSRPERRRRRRDRRGPDRGRPRALPAAICSRSTCRAWSRR